MRFDEVHLYSNDWISTLTHEEIAECAFPLVTNRTQNDVDELKQLSSIGWENMNAAQKLIYDAGMRGSYKASDANRVSEAEMYILQLFNSLPEELRTYLDTAIDYVLLSLKYDAAYYTLPNPVLPDTLAAVSYTHPITLADIKDDWTDDDRPAMFTDQTINVFDISYYLANIEQLMTVLPLPDDVPELPTDLEQLTYEEANNIEWILIIIYETYLDYLANKTTAIEEAKAAETDKQDRAAKSWIWANEVYAGEV